jgi:sRNA-binding regulator protein Hfq
MKETMDPVPAEISDKENFANRKLIRPTLPRAENYNSHNSSALPQERRERPERSDRHDCGERMGMSVDRMERGDRGDRGERHDRPMHDRTMNDRAMNDRGMNDRPMGGGMSKKPSPPEQTNAENFYYQKQMQSRTPMVIVLRDGEEVRGIIEWYDRNCIKVNRENGDANLMIYKPAIKYMFKEGENQR